MLRRNAADQTNDGPSASPQTKRVRFDLPPNVPITSRVGAPELSNRIGTWWMNPRMADVKFNVGPPDGVQEVIPAHILVVAPSSEVFSAMLLGSFDVPPTIDVPDGDPHAFKEMLRYVYTDSAVVTVGNASELMYLAKKYLLSGLIKQVIDYMKDYVGSLAVRREVVLHEELREVCAEFIAKHANDIFLSDDFMELDFDEMRKVAAKSLAVDTPTFYRKLMGWAQEECQRRSVDASTANMRCVLADAFKLIRFIELSPEEFEQGPGSDELLTVHEKAVFRHWHEHGDFRSLIGQKPITTFRIFVANPDFLQGREGVCAINERQSVVDAFANRPIVFEAREVFDLEFETDKCIFFSGVTCSFRAEEAHFTLSVDGRTLATSEPIGCDYQRSYTFDNRGEERYGSSALKLDSPVLIQAHRKYKVSVTANDAVGAQTRRGTQVIGREWESAHTMAEVLQGGRHADLRSDAMRLRRATLSIRGRHNPRRLSLVYDV